MSILLFTQIQGLLMCLSFIFLGISFYFHLCRRRNFWVMLFLGLAALSVYCFAALLDPFLNLWDERFHALVGKNLLNHPLKPTLYDDPVVTMAYDRWGRSIVWLHKQPLFLWQIAISFKLFGISEFTLRLPSVLLGVLIVLIAYRAGNLLFNRRVGYLSAVLFIFSFYLVELIAGRQSTDHNDVSFLAYNSLCIWAYVEYTTSKKKHWILFIGLFSGMAILCKWLPGLLVFFAWGTYLLQEKNWSFSSFKDLLLALSIAVLIFMPWQLLSFIWYPNEALEAQRYNALHFTEILEGHGGLESSPNWFHFEKFGELFGPLSPFLILPSFYIAYRLCSDKKMMISLLSMVVFTYLFYSMAATKMTTFPFIIAMIVFIVLAVFLDYILAKLKSAKMQGILFTGAIVLLVGINFNLPLLKEKHALQQKNEYSMQLKRNKQIYKNLHLPSNTVLFNVKGRHYVEAMFYTGLPTYSILPSEVQFQDLIRKNKQIAVFHTREDKPLPAYLMNSFVIVIDKKIKGFE